MFTEEQGRLMLALARAAIAREFDASAATLPHPDWLATPGAVFVTLSEAGRLRGCIGSLEAHRPLGVDLEHNARAAAFSDPRFPPLARAELPRVRVEVSVLTPASPLAFTDEADALAQLRPGMDGVILEHGWHRATFLPQVWEQLPEPRQFMSHLKQKAGLSGDFWAKDLRLYRYGVEKFKEERV
ncbi:MAG: AmmeMemoRadiSam system protein A [Gallionellaceae bacterium]|nr:AmmeMemoRadiSam system protein A [Gallionellaceae bacterium]